MIFVLCKVCVSPFVYDVKPLYCRNTLGLDCGSVGALCVCGCVCALVRKNEAEKVRTIAWKSLSELGGK